MTMRPEISVRPGFAAWPGGAWRTRGARAPRGSRPTWRWCAAPLLAIGIAAAGGAPEGVAQPGGPAAAPAGTAAESAPAGAAGPDALVAREGEIRDQFRDLERTFLRLADLLAATDPRRSALLRTAFEQAREAEVSDRLDAIVAMLEKGQLLKAGTSQATAIEKLRELLVVLEAGDTDRRLANTKEEVRQFLARLGKVIARQRDVEGSTEAGGEAAKLAERQAALARETEELARDIGGFAKRMAPADAAEAGAVEKGAEEAEPGKKPGGKPNEQGGKEDPSGRGQPGEQPARPSERADGEAAPGEPTPDEPTPDKNGKSQPGQSQGGKNPPGQQGESGESEPAEDQSSEEGEEQTPGGDDEASRAKRTRQRLQAAEKKMRTAEEKLAEANRRDARQDQEKAVEELETARAELEEILRQMREEEVERVLVQLGARLRTMLRIEKGVLSGAEKLAAEGNGPAPGDRERQLEATRLAREQTQVGAEATRALALVRDDGSAVAIPEALVQLHDDATQVAGRLGRGDVGTTSRGIMQDIIANLEEMIAALEKAQAEQQARAKGESGGRPAQPGEQPLVDKLSELKMIRSLQMRVNTRTGRFAQLLAGDVEQAEEPELFEAVRRLAERQRTIERAAHDIVTGRTE